MDMMVMILLSRFVQKKSEFFFFFLTIKALNFECRINKNALLQTILPTGKVSDIWLRKLPILYRTLKRHCLDGIKMSNIEK